jgi:hypothetical protein
MREYTDIDFLTINEWSKHYGLELDKELLSPLGFIDNNIYCSVYLAVGANCVFVDNFIASPEANAIAIKNSIKELYKEIEQMLLSSEGTWSVRITAIEPLAGILEKLGGIVDPESYKQILFYV